METLELNKHEAGDKLLAKSERSHDSKVGFTRACEDDDNDDGNSFYHHYHHDHYHNCKCMHCISVLCFFY